MPVFLSKNTFSHERFSFSAKTLHFKINRDILVDSTKPVKIIYFNQLKNLNGHGG